MDASEEQQFLAPRRVEGKVLQPDAVMDRPGIAKRGMAVGIADRDIGAAIIISRIDRHDPLRRKAVDGRDHRRRHQPRKRERRSEEHTSELQSLMRNSYAVFCLKKKRKTKIKHTKDP